MRHSETLVVGGGVMGLSIAWGLARKGLQVNLIDAGGAEPRASVANFGLVWLQSKGYGFPAYAQWTRKAIDKWTTFADDLLQCSGIDPHYRRTGGLAYCLGEAEWHSRTERMLRMRAAHTFDPYESEMIDRIQLEKLMPGVGFGSEVTGACWNPHDSAVDPLRLMHALRISADRSGVKFSTRGRAIGVVPSSEGFKVLMESGEKIFGERIVLAAGLGNPELAKAVDIDQPVHSDRGQIIVTERLSLRLPLPANGLRQTLDGTVMIGATKEGLDRDVQVTNPLRTTVTAARAVRTVPALGRARVVRVWAGLRTLSNDAAPVYSRSSRWPGAIAINCHSGITLAPLHSTVLADWVLGNRRQTASEDLSQNNQPALDESLISFSPKRFHVPTLG